ncbi:MAG: hypothetical protein ACKOQ6_11665 [Bacteroidota bacterium]
MIKVNNENIKADPLGGLLPQEIITGDVLRGYGPRRGNLERLLRYWRPIMKKPGGFRRCRVILANHPELYPLSNICAWLHHETTGLWPNEGCHHPGMKNCRNKLRKLMNWNDSQFASRLRTGKKPTNLVKPSKAKSLDEVFFHEFKGLNEDETNQVVTESDVTHAYTVLSEFMEMEPEFVKYLRDENNWEFVGDDENGNEVKLGSVKAKSLEEECCGKTNW